MQDAVHSHPAVIEEFAFAAKELAARGWGGECGGNLSVRMPDGSVFITRTGASMAQVAANPEVALCLVNASGAKLAGEGDPSMEVLAHLFAYETTRREYPEVAAMAHSHPPALMRWAEMEPRPRLRVVELGNEEIAVIPPLPEGSRELAEATAEAATQGARLIIWRGHGAVALDETLHEAIALLEHAEEEAELMAE